MFAKPWPTGYSFYMAWPVLAWSTDYSWLQIHSDFNLNNFNCCVFCDWQMHSTPFILCSDNYRMAIVIGDWGRQMKGLWIRCQFFAQKDLIFSHPFMSDKARPGLSTSGYAVYDGSVRYAVRVRVFNWSI